MTTMDRTSAAFLAFLAKDIESRPDKLSSVPSVLLNTIANLTANVDSDPDAPIDAEVMRL
jgi:antitoxin PrlF